MQKLPVVAIVGRPNVGKSTLFNRLIGFRQAIISDTPGTTRDRIFKEIIWNNKPFILFDTAGFLSDFYGFKEDQVERLAQKGIEMAAKEASLILFVIDAKSGLTPYDEEVASNLRKLGKKVVLVVNKADSQKHELIIDEYKRLGAQEIIAVSAISGRRTGDLLDLITKDFKESVVEREKTLGLAIVGRPNVGKSTLFNVLAKEERAIVSEVPGTTRDKNDFEIKIESSGKSVRLRIVDTAGLRRRGKIVPGIERFSAIRTIDSIIESDLVVLLVDSKEGITRGDAHLGQMALDKKKQLLIVLNKIDLLKERGKHEIPNLNRYAFLAKNKMIAISAKDKVNIGLLKDEVLKSADLLMEQSGI